MLTWLKLPFFVFYLLFLNLLTVVSFLWMKLQKYNLIILLYFFLFIQAIILMTQQPASPPSETFNFEKYQKVVNKELNLEGLNQYQFKKIEVKQKPLEEALNKQTQLLEKQPLHRDLIINQALLELILGDEQQFKDFLNKAKKIDPNWVGFKD